MRILLIHFGDLWECLASTSLLRKFSNHNIDILVDSKHKASIFRGHECVNNLFIVKYLPNDFSRNKYDLSINLHYSFNENIVDIQADKKLGFNYADSSFPYYKILYGNKKTKKNIFQVYFNIAEETWKGEHPCISYYPRNKSSKKKTGILIDNRVLKDYMLNELNLNNSKLWYIPHKSNFHKQLDELNRCKMIITDNFLSLLMSLCLKKNIYFLKRVKYNFNVDLLGMGEIFEVPKDMLL